MAALIDISGRQFGRLTVISRAPNSRHRFTMWRCRCTCGKETVVWSRHLRRGVTNSCGCLRGDLMALNGHLYATHGHAGKNGRSREYESWIGAKQRCFNPHNKGWENYGGRGITMCARWRDSFEAFLSDVGPCPGPGYSLDRINNDGDYEPANVRWATAQQQIANQRRCPTCGGPWAGGVSRGSPDA